MIGEILYLTPIVSQDMLLGTLLEAGQKNKEGELIKIDDVKNNRITASQLADIISNPNIIYQNVINEYFPSHKIPFMVYNYNDYTDEMELAYFYPNDNYKSTTEGMDFYVISMICYYDYIIVDNSGEIIIYDYKSLLEFTKNANFKAYSYNQPHLYDLNDGISFVNMDYEKRLLSHESFEN